MNWIPFSVYDFFGYLASGFLLLAAVDYAFAGGSLLEEKIGIPLGLFWTVVAYITGHIVATIAGYLLEKRMVRDVLGSPEETLFQEKRMRGWMRVFPGFFEPLPKESRERVLLKAKEKAGIGAPGRGLFFHCHPIVKRDQPTLERLNTFLNLYGFCRNISMSLMLAVPVLLLGSLPGWWPDASTKASKLWWAVAAIVAAVAMFYRYLKFFRHYTMEVFITYAETD